MKLLKWVNINTRINCGVDWYYLSENPNAIELLKQHPDKIDWVCLSKNSSIFEIDYKKWDELIGDFYYHYIHN